MERNSVKYSDFAMMSKEEQQPMKACFDDSMEPKLQDNLPTWILERYDNFGCLCLRIKELDMCNNVTRFESGFGATHMCCSITWRVFPLFCTYLYLQICHRGYQTFFCILEDLFKQRWHVWLYKLDSTQPSNWSTHDCSTWRLLECFLGITELF